MNIEAAIDLLTMQGYKIVKKYEKPEYYALDNTIKKFTGVYVDVETTGLNPSNDKIIELGIVAFEFSSDGRIFKILEEANQYQDPYIPIPQIVIDLTGITDDMVKDAKIDKDLLLSFITKADLIISHNASFDRGFLENFLPSLPQKPWGCSMKDIQWKQEGVESGKLEYIAYKFGFYFDGHRAVSDCLAGVHVLSKNLPKSKKPVLSQILETCRQPKFKIWALGARIEYKDILKSRGYQWNTDTSSGKHYAWSIELNETEAINELVFLWSEIYQTQSRIPIYSIPPKTRFSTLHNVESREQSPSEQLLVENVYNAARAKNIKN